MNGESNLEILLANMAPDLKDEPYVFLTAENFSPEEQARSLMVFKENEGITLITKEADAQSFNKKYQDQWAMITLNVHSDLNAVGFLAAITEKLAKAGISVNAVSAYYHDHLFVPWEKRNKAIGVLNSAFTDQS